MSIVGVVAPLEVGRVLAEQRVALKHPYKVVIYPEEEGTRFGAVLTGSKAWVGELRGYSSRFVIDGAFPACGCRVAQCTMPK